MRRTSYRLARSFPQFPANIAAGAHRRRLADVAITRSRFIHEARELRLDPFGRPICRSHESN
jgi:hypothetical protein